MNYLLRTPWIRIVEMKAVFALGHIYICSKHICICICIGICIQMYMYTYMVNQASTYKQISISISGHVTIL